MANIDLTQAEQLPQATVLRYRDMGDGTHAIIFAPGPLPAGDNNIGNVDVLTLPPLVESHALVGHVVLVDMAGHLIEIDAITGALATVTHGHHEIHEGRAFAVSVIDIVFNKSDEINVCFTTPDTTRWKHAVALVNCSTNSVFSILRGPTITAGTGVAYAPRNRNENSDNTSGAWSMAAIPIQGQVTLNATIAADGFVLHQEILGGGKNKSGAGGLRDLDEYMLRQNTTYAYRLAGTGSGSDNSLGGMHLSWYEHVDMEREL